MTLATPTARGLSGPGEVEAGVAAIIEIGPISGMATRGHGVTWRKHPISGAMGNAKGTAMGVVYHWSDRRSDFALEVERPVTKRLRPLLKLAVWVAIIVVPWAVLSLVAWSLLNLFPLSSS
ncbi:MAG TPA: hypothetical protein VHT04_07105 [Stellaceae bacterium]|nr:hypothetical protein [Stellaceae bacterium]